MAGYAGGSLASAEQGQRDIYEQELRDPSMNEGDRAALRRSMGRLQTVSNADKLISLAGGDGGATPAPSDNVSKLIKLAGTPVADTSDPKGNMDPRDIRLTQDYADMQPPSWMDRAKQSMAAVPPARAALEAAQPGVANAVARSAVPTIIGAPGDMIDFAGNTVPRWLGAKGLGGKTGLPTSEDVSGALGRAGWADQRQEHPIASQFGGALGAVTPMGPIADAAVIRPMIGKFTRGAQLAEDAQRGVSGAAQAGRDAIVGQHPMPTPAGVAPPVQDVRPTFPGPRADEPIPVQPLPARPPARTAPATPSSQLEAHIAENDARIAAEKQAAFQKYKEAPPPKGIDLQEFKDDITTRISRAGTEEEANALRKVLNNINRIESESDTQFESLDKLRRQLGKQAKFGEETSGYEAIGAQQGRELNRALGERMKAEHPAYAEYTKKYSDLSQEAAPSSASFLKQAGAEEGSANLVKNALASPKNVDQTIAAIGADGAKKLDSLAVTHVQNTLGRKTGQALEDAYTDMLPSLEKLPQARARAESLIRSKQLDQANEGIVEKLMQQHTERVKQGAADYAAGVKGAKDEAAAQTAMRMAQARNQTGAALREQKAAEAAHREAQQVADSYTPLLNNLQNAELPKRRISMLRAMNDKMRNDKLISDTQHAAFGEQIEAAASAADKQQKLQTLSKYIAYTLTGNYMISFGGPHLVSYLSAK